MTPPTTPERLTGERLRGLRDDFRDHEDGYLILEQREYDDAANAIDELLALRAKLEAARPALEAGAICLEATALEHRHPLMSKGATRADTNDALRAGEKASNEKLAHAAVLRSLSEVPK